MAKAEEIVLNGISAEENWRVVQRDIGLLGNSEAMRQLIETIEQIAPTDISVLKIGRAHV